MEIAINPPLGPETLPWLERWPYLPYRYCPGTTPRTRASYVAKAISSSQDRGASTFVALRSGTAQALLQLENLPWDSELLGFPVARVSWWVSAQDDGETCAATERLLRMALDDSTHRGIRYLLIRVPAGDLTSIRMLENNEFEMVDGLLTFGVYPTRPSPSEPQHQSCTVFQDDDLPCLQEIAASSFSIDRFHADPAVGTQRADEIHRRWIEDSCRGFADCVLVARGREPVGFTTLKMDRLSRGTLGLEIGIIVLVATAQQRRGQGIARALTVAALRWFADKGCRWVEVGTQLANIQASRVYLSAGFKLTASSLTLRRLL